MRAQLVVCKTGKASLKQFNLSAKCALVPTGHMVWKGGMSV